MVFCIAFHLYGRLLNSYGFLQVWVLAYLDVLDVFQQCVLEMLAGTDNFTTWHVLTQLKSVVLTVKSVPHYLVRGFSNACWRVSRIFARSMIDDAVH